MAADKAVPHHCSCGARRVVQSLDVGNRGHAARAAPHKPFIMSRMSRAVVEPSSVTGLSSGRGGGFTVSQSSRISAAEDDAANAIMIIMSAAATAAALHLRVRMPNIVSPSGFCPTDRHFSGLLRAVEEAHVYGLAEDVSLYRFHYVCASLECVRARLDIDLRVQSKKFKSVMVPRAIGRSARASINLAARADLIGAVLQLSSHRDTFRKSGCGARNIPDQPMKLIIRSAVATGLHVMHVQKEAHRARGDVGPRDCWRRLVAGLSVFRRNVGTIGESRNGHHHRRGSRPSLSTAGLGSATALSSPSLSRDRHGKYGHHHENQKQSKKSHLLCLLDKSQEGSYQRF